MIICEKARRLPDYGSLLLNFTIWAQSCKIGHIEAVKYVLVTRISIKNLVKVW
jgi:hypothetical protein